MGHHWPASETPFKWRFTGVPIMAEHFMLVGSFEIFQGIQTSIAKKPYIFVIFQGGSEPPVPPPPPLWIRPWYNKVNSYPANTCHENGVCL